MSGVVRPIVQGTETQVNGLVQASQGDGVINTACIERLNAPFQTRLAGLVRRGRNLKQQTETLQVGVYLVGTVYCFCSSHESLRVPLYLGGAGRTHWVSRTPTMAAGITDHLWSVLDYTTVMSRERDGHLRSIAAGLPMQLENLANAGVKVQVQAGCFL